LHPQGLAAVTHHRLHGGAGAPMAKVSAKELGELINRDRREDVGAAIEFG